MKKAWDIRTIDFAPFSEVKAKLSAFMRRLLKGGRSLVITHQGRPAAVLMDYGEYISLLERVAAPQETRVLTMKSWQRDRSQRKAVVQATARLFDADSLSRKGQKAYKAKALRDFD